jgi:hypothetical protein
MFIKNKMTSTQRIIEAVEKGDIESLSLVFKEVGFDERIADEGAARAFAEQDYANSLFKKQPLLYIAINRVLPFRPKGEEETVGKNTRDNGLQIFKMLLKKGADPNKTVAWHAALSSGLSPLKLALISPSKGWGEWSDELQACCEELLRAGAIPESESSLSKHFSPHSKEWVASLVKFLDDTTRELQKEQNIPKILQLAKNEIIPPEVLRIIAEKVYNQKYDHVKQRRLWCKENNIQLY